MSMAGEGGCGKVDSLAGMAAELGQFVRQAAKAGRSLREVERGTFDMLLRMGHAAIEQFLALQGDGDLGETVTSDEGARLYRSLEPVARPLRTIFGQHEFCAFVYRKRRHPHTPIVLRPLDARMSLGPGHWSALLDEFSQLFCIEQAFEPAAAAFETIFRQRLSVDTLEQVNLRMGAQAAEFLQRLEPPPPEEEGELLVLTADGKGVPMVQADAARLAAFEERPLRPGNRRMATLAAVYSVDRHVRTPEEIVAALFRDVREEPAPGPQRRPEPRHKRVIARFPRVMQDVHETEPVSGTVQALSWAAREVELRRRQGQPLVRLMDGQMSLWEAADTCVVGVPPEETIDILDIVHVAGYVWRAAKVFHTHYEHQEAFARERLLRILQGNVKGVVAGLRSRATRRGLSGKARQEIDTVCGYLEAHAGRMKYDAYLAAGYPIATGVIEGACRHLVKDRMERSGMRWTQPHAQGMLDVRAVHQSSYWEDFHQRRTWTEQRHRYQSLLRRITPLTG